jgi:pyruvate dehydrogenase E2 component (dihydrolipoamide acetyltransferase)
MAVTVTMPQLGETVTEGTILRWAKQPGDTIAADEALLEVSTDKVDSEVPSPVAGVLLQILVPTGETVAVGTPLAIIGSAADMPAAAPAQLPQAVPGSFAAVAEQRPVDPAPEPAMPFERPSGRSPDLGFFSPVVRKMAVEQQVDLNEIAGTGHEGRVTRKDVQTFIDEREQAAVATSLVAQAAVAGVAAAAPDAGVPEHRPAPALAMPLGEILPARVATPVPVPSPAATVPAEPAVALVEAPSWAVAPAEELVAAGPAAGATDDDGGSDRVLIARRAGLGRGLEALIPAASTISGAPAATGRISLREGDRLEDLDRMRLRIAEHMIHSRRTAAHVWTSMEADYEAIEQVRRVHGEAFKEREGFSLTYLPFIARATIDALAAYPVVNSSIYLKERKRVLHGVVNLGIAVDLDQRGLLVMNIAGADGMRMRVLARRIRAAADKAHSGSLLPDDAAGSTFTITNPGPFGSFASAPIINLPEVAILSTEAVTKRPVVVKDDRGNDAIGIRHIGCLGLTWDHRAFDGSTATMFLGRIKEILESRDWELELG